MSNGLKEIIIKGAKTHNLKNIDLIIPKEKLCVITGLSGSGKSSLAFDTIYAEGQRRYVESLSSYARQFLDISDKPDVEHIEGLAPAISIEQKSTSRNPRSTVGTITEIHDYLRVLYARIGIPQCPEHKLSLKASTISEMVESILQLGANTKIMILAPIVRRRKGEFKVLLENLAREGFSRARIDGDTFLLSEPPTLELHKTHSIEIIVDRLIVKLDDANFVSRLVSSLETTLKRADGLALISSPSNDFDDILFSQNYSCPECGFSISELEPRNFSFNNPQGACPKCLGLGFSSNFYPEYFISNENLSIAEGAIKFFTPNSAKRYNILVKLAQALNFNLNTPYTDLTTDIKNTIFYGSDKLNITYKRLLSQKEYTFNGIINYMVKHLSDFPKYIREDIEEKAYNTECKECNGERIALAYRNVFINNKSLPALCKMSILELLNFFENIKLSNHEMQIAERLIKEIKFRLQFLVNVGLDYLNLERSANTLSGGESQRIRLASQIGTGLTGVLYVLDEPSIGLHQRDNEKLLQSLIHLKNLGNSVIVVEHDEDTMRQADHIIDIGPGAGVHGGEVVAQGTLENIINEPRSITGQYLSGKRKILIPKRKKVTKKIISIFNAQEHNLQGIDVHIPIGLFTCVTGVSGSGKSTLINDTLYAYTQSEGINHYGKCDKITGLEQIERVINIDQSPIGRTPRSNPATYVDIFTEIREIFALTKEARAKGFTTQRFSFNLHGGRCDKCSGDGVIRVEMNFLPDVYVLCDECHGQRYNQETLKITYKEKTISDVLNMTVDEALLFFDPYPSLKRKLQILNDVGLGYIKLGQNSTTLSGGEAQRIKLAKELSKTNTGKNLYILDEPTTGLHFQDIEMLLKVLIKLRDCGNTIIVIEHNLDIIKSADYIIDLGPEGGSKGGNIIACGTPKDIVAEKRSYTGQFLQKIL